MQTERVVFPRWLTAAALVGLAALTAALYLPYLGNPPVLARNPIPKPG